MMKRREGGSGGWLGREGRREVEEGRREGEGRRFYSWGGGDATHVVIVVGERVFPQIEPRTPLCLKSPGKQDMMSSTTSKR